MATLEIDTRPRLLPAPPITASPFRHVRRRRKRLALISTHNDLCGIAAYTRSLEKQLNDVFEVTVFDLDQYLLRSTHRRVRKFGDRHILEICREIRDYEAVNLQLEHGTLGRDCHDIHRRFSWILRAAPRLSVTFHTVFQCEAFNYREYFREILKRNFARAIAMRAQYNRAAPAVGGAGQPDSARAALQARHSDRSYPPRPLADEIRARHAECV